MNLKPLILSLLVFMTARVFSQTIGDVQMDERSLYAMTKQMGQFISRFNHEEDQFGKRIRPDSKSFRDNKQRRKSITTLFDKDFYNQTPLTKTFIDDITNPDSAAYMEFLGGRWYSEVSATFTYNNKDVEMILFLTLEKAGKGSEWVLTNVLTDIFTDKFFECPDTLRNTNFLHPMSHEIDFMNIYKIFHDPTLIECYAPSSYSPDFLTLFFYEVKNGRLQFKNVNSLKFHVFQIRDWYFEVSWFDRKGNNSGWLISNLMQMPESEKSWIIKYYQP